jgi:hypothetical protein
MSNQPFNWQVVRARTPYRFADISDPVSGDTNAARQQTTPVVIRQQTPFGLNEYVLPFAPVEVTYSNIARQFVEIKRPGDWAIIDDAGPSLIQAQMQFRISDRASYGRRPCEDQIEKLRTIGLWAVPCLFLGLDSLISRPSLPTVRFTLNGQLITFSYWNILDLSIAVIRRNNLGQATQADVSLTIVENRNPNVQVIRLPFIDFSDSPRRQAGTPNPGGPGGGGNSNISGQI